MNRKLLLLRRIMCWITVICASVVLANCVRWWWSMCNDLPDRPYLMTTNEIIVKAGCYDVYLPKGLVLYPVDEHETNDECYPGGQYKIYVSLETDGSNLNSVGWPKGMTNLIYQLKK